MQFTEKRRIAIKNSQELPYLSNQIAILIFSKKQQMHFF